MSVAGIRSNRGDGYQTLVAFNWALFVLTDPDFAWIEVDSVSFQVDDIVIGRTDGNTICCQCKKNQPDFNAWSIADLTEEFGKASHQLVNDHKTTVRFYTRGSFGNVAKLREHSKTQPSEERFLASLGKELTDVELSLKRCLAGTMSTYDFLQRVSFDVTPEIDQMRDLLRERLRYLVTSPERAFDALWSRLDLLGARFDTNGVASTQHRLEKEDLLLILRRGGAVLAPVMGLSDIRKSFASTSAIGRTWRRDIAGVRLCNPVVPKLIAAIRGRERSILLTGLPGSGKTCSILEVQESLEEAARVDGGPTSLFIQAREFVDFASSGDRQAQGLDEQWVEQVARMAETGHVVIVVDSLDVLSIAREHSVLKYFLAQIDRLLLIQGVTVVAVCRDFDRHYDRRIAERRWDQELKCEALIWETDIEPLLSKLAIDPSLLKASTRELIRNPREFALYVELAQRRGGFNVVTSQALAQQYLRTVVQADSSLGDAAMVAIESMADEMLKLRSLAIPRQRFRDSQETLRLLLSQNVVHETQEGRLTFGHQTLLDVLVISSALRRSITLAQFIDELPPVPFVRPSVRSFVVQLATGERKEFRKQVRIVLMGSSAFHIRRLVAKSFAELTPHDSDWPMLRDLRNNFREVFQVVYLHASTIIWHNFWLKHLVPTLLETKDADGMIAHAHRVAHWKNEDPTGVLAFWSDVIELDWIDQARFAHQIEHHLAEFELKNAPDLAPFLRKALSLPLQAHSSLGRAIALCIEAGGSGDELLWRYIAGAISTEDVCGYQLGSKLRCQSYDFGDRHENFLLQRMGASVQLLDLGIRAIEQWSLVRISQQGEWMAGSSGFLECSSYSDTHSDERVGPVEGDRILMDAIEATIVAHAKEDSKWWQWNRERLCFSHEGVLRYFAIRGLGASPSKNIELVGRVACNMEFLESELSYEIGTLLKAAFVYLSPSDQEALQDILLLLHGDELSDAQHRYWILRSRAELISVIPCYLRSPEAQEMLSAFERFEGAFIREPEIRQLGGWVRAPFSFDVLLAMSDAGIIKLLIHYSGYTSWHTSDFITGGERQVGGQLIEAASRDPLRFLRLLSHYGHQIPIIFQEDIIEGGSKYLTYCGGNVTPNSDWKPVSEPDPEIIALEILSELERHTLQWERNRSASKGLRACSQFIKDLAGMDRIVFLAVAFIDMREQNPIIGAQRDLLIVGANMAKGNAVEALMILATHCSQSGIGYPELLAPSLRRFAHDEQLAIRALILRRLPLLQSLSPDFAWVLFDLVLDTDTGLLWPIAEPCLYYAYRDNFTKVHKYLIRIRKHDGEQALETWGRISALSAFSMHLDFVQWLDELKKLDNIYAWRGAASVWTHHENVRQHREQCLAGIDAGLSASGANAVAVAKKVSRLFNTFGQSLLIPSSVIQRCLAIFETDPNNMQHDFFTISTWLNAAAHRDPDSALASATAYVAYVRRTKAYLHDNGNNFTQLLTRLFAEAEEREGADQGCMLKDVVALQDSMLSLGVNGIDEWLGAFERP